MAAEFAYMTSDEYQTSSLIPPANNDDTKVSLRNSGDGESARSSNHSLKVEKPEMGEKETLLKNCENPQLVSN